MNFECLRLQNNSNLVSCLCYSLNIFNNYDFNILKCLVPCVGLENGSCQFFYSFSRSMSKFNGHGFRIYRANDYITIYVQNFVNLWSKPGKIVRIYLTAIPNATFK